MFATPVENPEISSSNLMNLLLTLNTILNAKRYECYSFLTFSGGVEMELWAKMD